MAFFKKEKEWEKEWQDMPEFEQKDAHSHQQINVHFPNKEAVQEFAELIGRRITSKTKSIWFPEDEAVNKKYVWKSKKKKRTKK